MQIDTILSCNNAEGTYVSSCIDTRRPDVLQHAYQEALVLSTLLIPHATYSILQIGVGFGGLMHWLLKNTQAQITGLDIDLSLLKIAEQHGVQSITDKVIKADLFEHPPTTKYDLVIADVSILLYHRYAGDVLLKCMDFVRPGGGPIPGGLLAFNSGSTLQQQAEVAFAARSAKLYTLPLPNTHVSIFRRSPIYLPDNLHWQAEKLFDLYTLNPDKL